MSILRIAALLTVVVAAYAQTGGPNAAGLGSAGPLQTFDVPTTGKPQTVYILHRVVNPGQSLGKHYHNGVEITQVIAGDWQLMVDGQETHVYHAGDSFLIPREIPHDGKSVGTTDAVLAVTYVLDKGAPLRVDCPDKTKVCDK